jgi:hypothetical protein
MNSFTSSPPRAGLTLLALAFWLVPAIGVAQAGFNFDRSMTVVQMHDDNLFSTPSSSERDEIWRLSPRLGLGRRSPRLTLHAHYGVDAEIFHRHPELSTPRAGQDAALDLVWAPSRLLAGTASTSYVETQTPSELNALTGLDIGRVRARRLAATAALSRRLGVLNKLTLEHSFTREEVVNLPNGGTQGMSLRLERRLGPVDRGRLGYGARRFTFGAERTLSHVVTLGWSRDVTARAHFELEAGPRLSGRSPGAEVNAGLMHRFRRGEAGFAYVHTQTTVVGHAGPVTAEGVAATFSRQLGSSLRVAGGPAVFRLRRRDSEVTVERLGLEVAWRVARRLSVSASDQFSLQRGTLDDGRGPGAGAEIRHHTLTLRAVAASAN